MRQSGMGSDLHCQGLAPYEEALGVSGREDSRVGDSRELALAARYKRPLDLVGGILLAVLTAPVAALVALLVKMTSPGPILFRQERMGQNARPFVLYKFRTMYHGADVTPHREYFKQYVRGVSAPGEVTAIYKLRHDPRITPIGVLLRRLALDEIPQLWNVIRGDMSLVGPRPPLAYEVEHYAEHHMQRLSIKPGITGLWQIRGRDIVAFETMIDMDLEYIKRQSLRLDLAILLVTGPVLAWSCIKR